MAPDEALQQTGELRWGPLAPSIIRFARSVALGVTSPSLTATLLAQSEHRGATGRSLSGRDFDPVLPYNAADLDVGAHDVAAQAAAAGEPVAHFLARLKKPPSAALRTATGSETQRRALG